MSKTYLSVIIPCYNEEENLRRGVLAEVDHYLRKQKFDWQVIISDDGSTDNSVDLIKKFCQQNPKFQLLSNQHAGKVFALHLGVKQAQGEIILTTDMDQSTSINQLDKLLPYFKKGYQVVIGSRGQVRTGFSIIRKIGSTVFRILRQQLLLKKIVDTQCGFKTYQNQIAKNLFDRLSVVKTAKSTKGWRVGAFDVELLFIAQKNNYQIAEVPVEWEDQDIAQEKQRKYFKESKEMLKEILRVKINDLKGLYSR